MATYDVKEVTLTVEPTENKPPIPQASCSLQPPSAACHLCREQK